MSVFGGLVSWTDEDISLVLSEEVSFLNTKPGELFSSSLLKSFIGVSFRLVSIFRAC
jgi:hypothetical protein